MKRIHCEPHETGIAFEYEGHASLVSKSVRGLWAAGVFRFGREIAGDRPPRYGKSL